MASANKPAPASQKSPQEKTVDRSAEKIANFKKLASKRVGNALAKMAGIRNLANRNSYTYDDAQVAKILTALKTAVNDIEAAFKAPASSAVKSTFEV